MVGNEAGSRRASLAAWPKILATLLASPERAERVEWADEAREIGSALRLCREETTRAGPAIETLRSAGWAEGVEQDIRQRPEGQGQWG